MIPKGLSVGAKTIAYVAFESIWHDVFSLNVSLTVEFFWSSEATDRACPGVVFISNYIQFDCRLKI